MIQNSNIILKADNLWLIPYLKEHVPKYHSWMKSPELLELTASEPLSLEEEYDMQRSWREDEDKCTFILFVPEKEKINVLEEGIKTSIKGHIIGDVNLFLNDTDDKLSAEIEIMVAESDFRGKGLGLKAILMMMHYGHRILNLERFTAKIGENNATSLKLFETKLGFLRVSYSKVFEEVTLGLEVKDNSEFYKLIKPIEEGTKVVSLELYNLEYLE